MVVRGNKATYNRRNWHIIIGQLFQDGGKIKDLMAQKILNQIVGRDLFKQWPVIIIKRGQGAVLKRAARDAGIEK